MTEGLFRYSRSIPGAVPSRDVALREEAYRNGWFLAGAHTRPHFDSM